MEQDSVNKLEIMQKMSIMLEQLDHQRTVKNQHWNGHRLVPSEGWVHS